jgi:pyruvate dehydrogenase E1 component
MGEVVDGQYQKYSVESGSYIRDHFFGVSPELRATVSQLSDEQLQKLKRGGHDPEKVYAAYKTAVDHQGAPSVILAKTIKGYGLGEAGEGRNITHQQKKLNEDELREFRARFGIPIGDDEINDAPFYKPADDSPEMEYLQQRRTALGGSLPARVVATEKLDIPSLETFDELLKGSGKREVSTTMALARLLTALLKHDSLKERIVPIIPDEARTFGMETLFRQCGIYACKGQLYEPVDAGQLMYYREAKDGQVLEEGINEAGAMSSFIAAGTAYANQGINMIPFYVYYSMFGFQRVGDLIWAAGDSRCKGFMMGGTYGRTTLNGEGLQHQDGHSHLMATTVPNVVAYDPAFAYELAVIVQDGMRRMYQEDESIFYFVSVYNENYKMDPMPAGSETGICRGLYRLPGDDGDALSQSARPQLFGSGPILREAQRAQKLLADNYGITSDLWSVTSYSELCRDAERVDRTNTLHPRKAPETSYLSEVLDGIEGPFIAASDNIRAVSEQIRRWVPGRYVTLGTDGFGRSDTREALRRHFEVDAECITFATLSALAQDGKFDKRKLSKALKDLDIDPNKVDPATA